MLDGFGDVQPSVPPVLALPVLEGQIAGDQQLAAVAGLGHGHQVVEPDGVVGKVHRAALAVGLLPAEAVDGEVYAGFGQLHERCGVEGVGRGARRQPVFEMADDCPGEVASLLLHDPDGVPDGVGAEAGVDGQGRPGLLLGADRRSEHLLLVGMQRPGESDLSDDPGPDASRYAGDDVSGD